MASRPSIIPLLISVTFVIMAPMAQNAKSEVQLGIRPEEKATRALSLPSQNDKTAIMGENNRRKRSIGSMLFIENDLVGEESLLALPSNQWHLHRDKRSPCHKASGGNDGDNDYDAIDEMRRRRRANANKRKAAASKKKTTKSSSFKKLTNDDEQRVSDVLARRKRQSELDDLNDNMENEGSEFSKHAQQLAEKIGQIWQGLVTSIDNVAQSIKQHFSGQNSTNITEI